MNLSTLSRLLPALVFPAMLAVSATPVMGQALHTASFETTPGNSVAPIDITGYWVALVTEDWRYRMMTPLKGDYFGVPLNLEGKKVADVWDPAKDEAAGEQCRNYGAANFMRLPGRLHISWDNDDALKVEMDTGQQTRIYHFGNWKPAPRTRPDWQGESMARWNWPGQNTRTDSRGSLGLQAFGNGAIGAGDFGGGAGARTSKPTTGSMEAVTRGLRPGYLRKNGIPYSADAVVTEYFDLAKRENGDQWLTVTVVVDDPKYLEAPYITSSHFRKQADVKGWAPEPCSAR
jgi:hypothetical protein